MRRSLLVVAVAALVAVPALHAGAAVQGLHIDRKAFYDLGDIHVSGTIACTPGQAYSLRLSVRQETGSGSAAFTFECEDGPDNFLLRISPETGSFTTGPARVRAVAETSDGDRATVSRTVRVVALN